MKTRGTNKNYEIKSSFSFCEKYSQKLFSAYEIIIQFILSVIDVINVILCKEYIKLYRFTSNSDRRQISLIKIILLFLN